MRTRQPDSGSTPSSVSPEPPSAAAHLRCRGANMTAKVDSRTSRLVLERQRLGRLAHTVLHRMPQPEVGRLRQRGDEFGHPNAVDIGLRS